MTTELKKQIAKLKEEINEWQKMYHSMNQTNYGLCEMITTIGAENQELQAKLNEMTKCRDNALEMPLKLAEEQIKLNEENQELFDKNQELQGKLEEAKRNIEQGLQYIDQCCYEGREYVGNALNILDKINGGSDA